jgi:hypothetical protein
MTAIQIFKVKPQHTAEPQINAPVVLISGTAVPAMGPEVNTAVFFHGISITLNQIIEPSENRKVANVHVFPKRRRSKRAKRTSETRLDFGMMAPYSNWLPNPAPLPRAVRTPLATKAQEEMSDFEREYPW